MSVSQSQDLLSEIHYKRCYGQAGTYMSASFYCSDPLDSGMYFIGYSWMTNVFFILLYSARYLYYYWEWFLIYHLPALH